MEISRSALAAVALSVLLALVLGVSAVAAPADGASDWKQCGRAVFGGGLPIHASHVGCKKARRVARKAGEQLGDCIESGCQAAGFTCRARPNEIEGGDIVCRRDERRVKFGYGG